jgi:hypothetical protein
MFIVFMFSEIRFESFCKFASGQHDASSAALAFQPDIRAEPDNRPLVRTTRMLFSQAQMIVHLQVGKHDGLGIQVSVVRENIIN